MVTKKVRFSEPEMSQNQHERRENIKLIAEVAQSSRTRTETPESPINRTEKPQSPRPQTETTQSARTRTKTTTGRHRLPREREAALRYEVEERRLAPKRSYDRRDESAQDCEGRYEYEVIKRTEMKGGVRTVTTKRILRHWV